MDATLRNRILLALALALVVALGLFVRGRSTVDTRARAEIAARQRMDPTAARARAKERDLRVNRTRRDFQKHLDEDSEAFGLRTISADELRAPNRHAQLVKEALTLQPGRKFESDWLEITAEIDKVVFMKQGAEIRAKHSLARVESKHDKPFAYFLDVRSADRGGCEVRGARQHNVNALLPGEVAEVAVCAGSAPIRIHRLEVLEVTPIGHAYLSQVPPRAFGHDETTAQAHHPGRKLPTCSQVPSERTATAIANGKLAWRDIADYFSRHNCTHYPWLWEYRYAQEAIGRLPVTAAELEARAALEAGEAAVEAQGPG